MNKILITTSSFDMAGEGYVSEIRSKGYEPVLNPFGRKLQKSEIHQLIADHQPVGIIAGVEPYDSDVIEGAQALKTIARVGVGVDSIDMQALENAGISVTITPTATTLAVSELTVGMILSLLRKIPAHDSSMKTGEWKRFEGFLLHGKVVGIVGCGRIGTAIARLLSNFGCTIIGYDPHMSTHDQIRLTSLESVLQQSNIITLHLPLTKESRNILNRERLQLLRKGSYLLNIARGGLVDEHFVYEQLQQGTLAGIAFDCFEEEPYNGPLIRANNAICTPHIGSAASEARVMMEREAIDNLFAALDQ